MFAARAALTAQPARVGTLFPGSQSSTAFAESAFWTRMRELGWMEGSNLLSVKLYADGRLERSSVLVGDLIASRVDVMVIAGTQGAAG